MRLAFCLFKYFPYGGMQADFLQTAKACAARGHVVGVYTLSWQGEIPNGLNVEVIDVKSCTNHGRYRAFAKAVQQRLQHDPVDAVVGFNKIPGLDFYFAADPCFVERARRTRSWLVRCLSGRHRLLAAYERSVFGKDSRAKIFYLSAKEKQKFLDVYATPEDRFMHLPPGIEREKLHLADGDLVRADKRRELGLSDDTAAILFVGSGFAIKGLDRAILSVANLPEFMREKTILLVAGDDSNNRYRHLVDQYGLQQQVQFLGGRADVPELLIAADCLLHPARNETGGKVLLEAAASGLPVVTTAACGFSPYIVDSRMGYVLAEPFVQESLNQLLQTCLNNLEREQWRQRALDLVAKTDIFGLAGNFADHLEEWGNQA